MYTWVEYTFTLLSSSSDKGVDSEDDLDVHQNNLHPNPDVNHQNLLTSKLFSLILYFSIIKFGCGT